MEKSWEDQHLRGSLRCDFGCCVKRCRPLKNSPCCLNMRKLRQWRLGLFLRSRLSLSSIVLVAKTVVISCKWGPVLCRAQPLIRAHFWIFLCRFGSQIEVTRPGTFLRHHWRQQLSGQYVHLAHDRFDNFAIHIGSTVLSGCVRSFVRNYFAFVRGEKWPFYNAAAPLCCVQMPLGNMLLRTQFQHLGL